MASACCLCIQCVRPGNLETKITSTFVAHFTDLNPLQPKRVFSALDRVSLAPVADSWAVRSGPPVSVALADSAGLPVSAPVERASADRYVAGYDFLDLTF
jgi:hypothetical protein